MRRYGVTWATADHSVAQTGYVYWTVGQATRAARRGPYRVRAKVDGMCEHYPTPCGKLYGLVQDPGDTVEEVEVEPQAPAGGLG